MAKKKKTRQQKIIADLRRQIYASKTDNAPFEEKTEKPKQPSLSFKLPAINTVEKKQSFAAITNTSYLAKDLQKTAILTASIITAQLILLFVLKNHILVLNGLIY